MKIRAAIFFLLLAFGCGAVKAYEHHDSLVEFIEYSDDVVGKNRQQNKPFFLLFSAEWCHWCHEFAEHVLVREDVAAILNQRFVNVFIDTDIHNSAYVKYRATGLPFSVFLNPDGSLYYRYTGTLYGDDFIDVINEVADNAGSGRFALGMEASQVSYEVPEQLDRDALEALPEIFLEGLLENFDDEEFGLGRERKLVLPRSFNYLLTRSGGEGGPMRENVASTLSRALERIYDPIEGGFFRYAETRNWQVPHYEKFADMNAGAVLLLYQLDRETSSEAFRQAADQTLAYLTSTLYSSETRSFLSFQIADTLYYALDANDRTKVPAPRVMNKIFSDRLVMTLDYLIPVARLTADAVLRGKIKQSLDFLEKMIVADAGLKRYYSVDQGRWLQAGGLSDHARLAHLFVEASKFYADASYADVAASIMLRAINRYYDRDLGIFVDPDVDDSSNVEYLMEMNSLMGLAIAGLGARLEPGGSRIIESILTYFSRMIEPLEDRLWNAVEWEFAESYVPFLQLIEIYPPSRIAGSG